MSITADDIKFRKSATVTDTGVNGGRRGRVEVITGARHNLFPRVTKAERTAGITRYRKQFFSNESPADDIAFGVLIFFETPSNADDRFYLGDATLLNTQADIVSDPPLWTGVGQLNANLSGGETQISLLMENDDFEFAPGGTLHLSDKVQTGQTIGTGVNVGDSVEESAGTWGKIAATDDIEYPKGIYLGNNNVLSVTGTTSEEFLVLAENKVTDEDIGTGTGATQTPTLSDLASVTNGLLTSGPYAPVVTTVCGGVARTVTINPDGSCSGYCSAGQINVATGVWTTDITWTTAPDNGEDILITYYDKNFSYAGNVVTIDLADTVANTYQTTNTFAAGCLEADEVAPDWSDFSVTSAAGTYDQVTYPPVLFNDGVEEDTWTITFTSASAFSCSGLYNGNVGSGAINTDFSPTNPNTGQPYFTLRLDGWGGTFAVGDTVTFKTQVAALPMWLKEIVDAATAAEPDNLVVLGYYAE